MERKREISAKRQNTRVSSLKSHKTDRNQNFSSVIPLHTPKHVIWVVFGRAMTHLTCPYGWYNVLTFPILTQNIDFRNMVWATWVKIWQNGHMGINYVQIPWEPSNNHLHRPTISAPDVQVKTRKSGNRLYHGAEVGQLLTPLSWNLQNCSKNRPKN